MRIIHVYTTLDPSAGGPPMVVSRLAAAQVGLGHDVEIFSYESPDSADRVDDLFARIPRGNDVVRTALPAATGLNRITARAASRVIEQSMAEADFVHVHGMWSPILLAAGSAAQRVNVPYALMPHGMLDPWSLSQRALKKKLALALGWRRLLNRAAFLHVLNVDEDGLMKPLGLKSPSEIIPNGIFPEELEPRPEDGSFLREHPELNDRPFILFLSRLHFKKGLDYLAGAFASFAKRNEDVHLVVAGPDGGAESDFRQRVSDAGLDNRVHLVGPLYGEQKLAALNDASCFCLPSRQEGFSIAITEALAFGLPVVISRECHFPEVEQADAGCVVELNNEKIADALLSVFSDDDRRQRMGEAGRELIFSQFTWPRIAEQSIATYEKYLRQPDRTS